MPKPTTFGPQIGVPPSLEQVPVAMLQVDPAYQRKITGPASCRLISRLVAQWDWRLFQPLTVARRADGSLFIIDGQHRHEAARQRGDIMFLPCSLQSSLDLAGEADTFIKLNTERQTLSQADIFHGQLARGDSNARRVQQLLDETGWTVRRELSSLKLQAGDINCPPMLVKRLASDGEEVVHFALSTLRQAWPESPVRSISTFLKALMEVHARVEDPARRTPDRVAEVLRASSPEEWSLAGMEVRSRNRTLSNGEALAIAITRAVCGEAPLAAPTPPTAPPSIAPGLAPGTVITRITGPNAQPAASPARAFTPSNGNPFSLEGGQAWCSQCEQRRTRANAATCKDKFCKLKGAI